MPDVVRPVEDLAQAVPRRRLDLRGETCPTTSDQTLRVLQALAPGEVLEVVSDYEPARSTIPYHCQKRGYPYLLGEPGGGGPGLMPGARAAWLIRIQKT
jgi:tRNA 2-thiouridine synthesizing protein A